MTCNVTYDELAAFAANDLPAARRGAVELHLGECAACRRRLDALRRADSALRQLRRLEPPPEAVRDARDAFRSHAASLPPPEIMTLDDVARFLRVPLDDVRAMWDELPAFELAGQIRVRRTKLMEWIEERERGCRRRAAEDQVVHELTDLFVEGAS